MEINKLIKKTDADYFRTDFMLMIESMLTYLRSRPDTTLLPVAGLDEESYIGDFYGLLRTMNVPKEHRYIVMRINGIKNAADYKGDMQYILYPNEAELSLLKNIYRTSRR